MYKNKRNEVYLEGRLCKDHYEGGSETKVIFNSLAVFEGTDKDGNEITQFHPIKAFGKTAEAMLKNTKKGDLISLWGKLDTYTQKKGEEYVTNTYVVVGDYLKRYNAPKNATNATEANASTEEELPTNEGDAINSFINAFNANN